MSMIVFTKMLRVLIFKLKGQERNLREIFTEKKSFGSFMPLVFVIVSFEYLYSTTFILQAASQRSSSFFLLLSVI